MNGALFSNTSLSMQIGRYHSLVADELPACLKVRAKTSDGEAMALKHESLLVSAVQLHPESTLSLDNKIETKIIRNVMKQVTMRAAT